jgi:acyl-coenzyme A synthetase/AMP-(fatty) acid ligase
MRSSVNGNLAATLARRAELFGWLDRPLFHTSESLYTHGAVHAAIGRASGVLHSAGVARGHRVLVALPDSVGLVAALMGTLRLGAVAVLTSPERPRAEHAHILHDTRASTVVCPAGLASRFPGTQVLTPGDLTGEPASIPDAEPLPPEAPAYIQYTSGVTGSPRGVVHRHSDARAYVEALALGALGLGPADVVLSASKACYPYGLGNSLLFPMCCGASAVLWPGRTGPAELGAQARRHRVTLLFGTPTVYRGLLDGDPGDFASLRAAAATGEPLPPGLADRVESFLGCPLIDGLGTTEVGHIFVSNTITRRRRGTLGLPLTPYEIQVRTGDGRPARVGQQGLLYVKGPSVFLEYLGLPGKTAEVLDRDGWLCTGDLVHVDADGFVHHHGRAADPEAVDGITVAPCPGRAEGVSESTAVPHLGAGC